MYKNLSAIWTHLRSGLLIYSIALIPSAALADGGATRPAADDSVAARGGANAADAGQVQKFYLCATRSALLDALGAGLRMQVHEQAKDLSEDDATLVVTEATKFFASKVGNEVWASWTSEMEDRVHRDAQNSGNSSKKKLYEKRYHFRKRNPTVFAEGTEKYVQDPAIGRFDSEGLIQVDWRSVETSIKRSRRPGWRDDVREETFDSDEVQWVDVLARGSFTINIVLAEKLGGTKIQLTPRGGNLIRLSPPAEHFWSADDTITSGSLVSVTLPVLILLEDTKLDVRVDGEGAISLPHIGLVDIGNLTERQAGEKISRIYDGNRVTEHPRVTVEMSETTTPRLLAPKPIAAGDTIQFRAWFSSDGAYVSTTVSTHVEPDGRVVLPWASDADLRGRTMIEAEQIVGEAIQHSLRSSGKVAAIKKLDFGPFVSALRLNR